MNRLAILLFACLASTVSAGDARREVGGPCDGCEWALLGMPDTMAAESRIASADEPGEAMTLTGVVYASDGRTPAAGVVVYAYHTDATGHYPAIAAGPAKGVRHGRLRAWARTGADGRYTFQTIRPAPYPKRSIPAHVHIIPIEPGLAPYWIDDLVFTDDPLVTAAWRANHDGRGGNGVQTPKRDAAGTWRVTRDIVLGRNIPDYAPPL
jgi:protocatechuate 3,4-dioxygenase beta subunit